MSAAEEKPPLAHGSPFDPAILSQPEAFDARLRAEAPVSRCPITGIVMIADHAHVTAVARDHRTFSNRFGRFMRGNAATGTRDQQTTGSAATRERTTPAADAPADERAPADFPPTGYPPVDTLLTQDPPLHRRYRGLISQAFTARRVTTLAPWVEQVCHELLDTVGADGRCDFVATFARRLPMTVIARELGVALADYDRFCDWSDAFVAQLSGLASATETAAGASRILAFQRYFAARIAERRQMRQDDIISDIVHARFEDERPLDVAEILSLLQQLLVAGNETTTHCLSAGVRLLAADAALFDRLQAQPASIERFTEEVLRLASPTANMWRVAHVDTVLDGVAIPAGSLVQLRYASANRDAAVFDRPDQLELDRPNVRAHVAFGYGIHQCIGASLARMEMNVAFRTLLERCVGITLDCAPEELVCPPNVLLHGLARLPLRFQFGHGDRGTRSGT